MDKLIFKQLIKLLEVNKNNFTNNIKLLLYKNYLPVLEKLDINNEDTFLEPLLFAYFNSKKNNLFPKEILAEMLQGYYLENDSLNIKYSFNKNSIAYIPRVGYFKKGEIKPFESILIEGDFELVKEVHPTQEKYFVEAYKGHIINHKPEYNSVWKLHYEELFKAINIIKKYLPDFYKELRFANKKIYLHDNPKIINFTSVETLGMLYFYVIGNNNLMYFIEELIHQGSHNYLYYVVHNRKDYFKIDVDNAIMRDYTKQEWDYRSIYGAFHGLFTVTQRVVSFDKLLSQNIFIGKEKHELLGRLTDQFSRFKTGLELLDFNQVYTEQGLALYNELTNKCESTLNKYATLKDEFDVSNRDIDFRYNHFCELNPFEEFLTKDQKNHYQF